MEEPFDASLLTEWQALPPSVRYAPASLIQLEEFERAHGPIPPTFREFLQRFGGGAVGSEWIDGIEQLWKSHAKFNSERGARGWTLAGVFVIGWDGAGNPLAIDRSGAVVMEDHNFAGVHQVASSFEAFLARGLGHDL